MATKLRKAEWDRVAEWWESEAGNKGVWHQQHDIDPVILKTLGKVVGKKIIEIGCGNGYFARILTKKGALVTAIDLSKKLLDFAIAKERLKPFGIRYLVRDAANLHGIKSASFDIAVANMSLMDIADAKRAVKEISRVLKKNGYFIFSITHPAFGEFNQQWVIIKEGSRKFFARAVNKYLSSATEKKALWASRIKATHYHKSVETYLKYLRAADFFISDFREIATKKPVTKAKPKNGNVKFRRSKYKTLSEKRIKEVAVKEIPMFLVIGALKVG